LFVSQLQDRVALLEAENQRLQALINNCPSCGAQARGPLLPAG
jgi:hypothetical protein